MRGETLRSKAELLDNGRVRSDMRDTITRDSDIMHEAPVFRGTRVPVKTLFDSLEAGESLDDFLEGFPTVNPEIAIQVLEESRELRLARI